MKNIFQEFIYTLKLLLSSNIFPRSQPSTIIYTKREITSNTLSAE